jgi:hypothetical protein
MVVEVVVLLKQDNLQAQHQEMVQQEVVMVVMVVVFHQHISDLAE